MPIKPFKDKIKHPKFLFILSFAELWERFSYHGVRALLVLYLTLELGYEDVHSFKIYSLYAIISYGGTIIFGVLADKYFSFLFLTRSGAIIIAIGHLLVTLSFFNSILIYYGIACIAFGTACFKGNIPNLLSNCYYHHPEYSREIGFTYFYTFISIGGFIAYIFCGIASKFLPLSYCFSFASLGMFIVIVIFTIYNQFFKSYELEIAKIKNHLVKNRKQVFYTISAVVLTLLGFAFSKPDILIKLINGFCFVVGIYYVYVVTREPNKNDRERLILSTVFILIAAAYYVTVMQLGSFVSLFLHRNVDRVIFGCEMPVPLCQSVYPGSTIIIGMITMAILSRVDLSKYVFSRLALGVFCTCISFTILYTGCLFVGSDFKVNIFSFILSMIFIGLGEVLVMPAVISQITNIAPKSRQGFIMGSLMMSLSFANLGGFYIAKLFSVDTLKGIDFDPSLSLKIYKYGFLKIVLLNLLFVLLISLCATVFKQLNNLRFDKLNTSENPLF